MTPLMGDTLKISEVTGGNNSWWMFTMGVCIVCLSLESKGRRSRSGSCCSCLQLMEEKTEARESCVSSSGPHSCLTPQPPLSATWFSSPFSQTYTLHVPLLNKTDSLSHTHYYPSPKVLISLRFASSFVFFLYFYFTFCL